MRRVPRVVFLTSNYIVFMEYVVFDFKYFKKMFENKARSTHQT